MLPASDVEPDLIPISPQEEDDELKERFATLTRQLEPKHRLLIVARYYHGLSVAEIAEQMQIDTKQVYNRLHYALRLMKEKL